MNTEKTTEPAIEPTEVREITTEYLRNEAKGWVGGPNGANLDAWDREHGDFRKHNGLRDLTGRQAVLRDAVDTMKCDEHPQDVQDLLLQDMGSWAAKEWDFSVCVCDQYPQLPLCAICRK